MKIFSYYSYKEYVESLFSKGLVTGNKQTTELLEATKLNIARTKRIDKYVKLEPKLVNLVHNLSEKMEWWVITEGWCGDSAQNLPIIAKICELSEMINLNIILRDENPTIMNKYLTNGKSSIPKLIVKNSAQQELFRWGPRPNKIQKKVEIFKKNYPEMNKNEFNKELHLWYAKNKTLVLQEDFKLLLQKIQ